MRTTAVSLSLALSTFWAGAPPASATPTPTSSPAAATAQYPRARIWVENDREYYRSGDRLRVNFSTSANSYVAVVHVDPDGYLEFLYPSSPWDAQYLRGGRTYSLDRSAWSNGLLVRGGSGIGYLYVIASPVPLDYSRFAAGSGWDWSYAGRSVTGDPFWAMEQITRMLLPGWGNTPYAADYYTYYVGGIQRYPSYACSSRGYASSLGWGYYPGWSSYYGSCDRLDLFLRDNPYYFDSRRYRGNRGVYYDRYRDARDWDPRHGYKEDPEVTTSRPGTRVRSPSTSGGATRVVPRAGTSAPASRPAQRPEPVTRQSDPSQRQSEPRSASPRPTEREAQPAAPAPRPRPTPRPVQRQPERSATTRPAPTPRASAPERSSTTRSSSPRPAPTPRASAPRSRGSSDEGSSSTTPRSRRGGD